MIDWLCQEYKSIFKDGSDKMSVIQGKVHKHLGMILDYSVCGQARITVFSYIEDILTNFYKEDPKGKGTNLMENDASWNTILHTFGLLNEALTKFTDDLSTVRDLMV